MSTGDQLLEARGHLLLAGNVSAVLAPSGVVRVRIVEEILEEIVDLCNNHLEM